MADDVTSRPGATPPPESQAGSEIAPPAGSVRDVAYRGEPLDAARGPGLGCFWAQVAILVVFIVLTPLSVRWNWPPLVSGILLFVVIGLLLFTGQTIIFLLRLVAADRRGRRRPLASQTRTVGELEDVAPVGGPTEAPGAGAGPSSPSAPASPGASPSAEPSAGPQAGPSAGAEDAPSSVRE